MNNTKIHTQKADILDDLFIVLNKYTSLTVTISSSLLEFDCTEIKEQFECAFVDVDKDDNTLYISDLSDDKKTPIAINIEELIRWEQAGDEIKLFTIYNEEITCCSMV